MFSIFFFFFFIRSIYSSATDKTFPCYILFLFFIIHSEKPDQTSTLCVLICHHICQIQMENEHLILMVFSLLILIQSPFELFSFRLLVTTMINVCTPPLELYGREMNFNMGFLMKVHLIPASYPVPIFEQIFRENCENSFVNFQQVSLFSCIFTNLRKFMYILVFMKFREFP